MKATGSGTSSSATSSARRCCFTSSTCLAPRAATRDELQALRASLEKPFSDRIFLWKKTKKDLEQEMDTALQVPGWGNIWTQPIINRINMLTTGIRSEVGVKVFGRDLAVREERARAVAEALRAIPGAVDVYPEQVTGAPYLDVRVNREAAAS